MATIAIVMQLIPYLISCGFEPGKATAMISMMGFFGLFGSYGWGWLDQKIGTKPSLMTYGIWYCVSLLLLIISGRGGGMVGAYVAVFMVGISVGGIMNLIPSITSTVFGKSEFVGAMAVVNVINSIVSSCASAVIAFSLWLTSGYQLCYGILIVCCIVGVIMVKFIKTIDYKKVVAKEAAKSQN